MQQLNVKYILWFCVKFLVLAVVCNAAWLWVTPWYAFGISITAGAALRVTRVAPVTGARVERMEPMIEVRGKKIGLGTAIYLAVEEQPAEGYAHTEPLRGIGLAHLVTNVPTFFALVLATGGLGLRRRLWSLLIGSAILVICHTIYIYLAFLRQAWEALSAEIMTAIGFVFITLPFLLWILLAFWEKLTALLAEADESGEQ